MRRTIIVLVVVRRRRRPSYCYLDFNAFILPCLGKFDLRDRHTLWMVDSY
jgi:hypothetical protein